MNSFTRCYHCYQKIEVFDEQYATRKEDRWHDPDWCIEHHWRTECPKNPNKQR